LYDKSALTYVLPMCDLCAYVPMWFKKSDKSALTYVPTYVPMCLCAYVPMCLCGSKKAINPP